MRRLTFAAVHYVPRYELFNIRGYYALGLGGYRFTAARANGLHATFGGIFGAFGLEGSLKNGRFTAGVEAQLPFVLGPTEFEMVLGPFVLLGRVKLVL